MLLNLRCHADSIPSALTIFEISQLEEHSRSAGFQLAAPRSFIFDNLRDRTNN
jgi:hypothetical protein